MSQYTVIDDNGNEYAFQGELVAETYEEHQAEPRHPLNTETVQLFRTNDNQYVLYLTFQFEGFFVHHREFHIGESVEAIFNAWTWPTDTALGLRSTVLAA